MNVFFEIPKKDYIFLENKMKKFKRLTVGNWKTTLKKPAVKKIPTYSKRFHKKIEKLLRDSGFNILESDYNKPGSDIVAEAGGKKIIVQCKQAEKEKAYYPKMNNLIDEYSRKVQKRNAEIAILALSRYDIPKKYREEKNIKQILKEDKVVIWTSRIIDYYSMVVKATKNYAKYTMFVDWNIRERFGKPIEVPAIKIPQKNYEFFIFAISPEVLLKSAYIARRLYSDKAYQRMVKLSRLKGTSKKEGIKDYLDDQEGVFPTNLVCAFESNVKFDEENKILKIPLEYGSIWLIDGQHRLFSFCHSKTINKNKYRLICSGFNVKNLPRSKITEEEQAKLFVTINQKAKKVTKELLLDLYEMIGKKSRPVEVAKALAERAPFESKIKTVRKSGSISLATFALTPPMERLVSDKGILSKWFGKSRKRKKISKEKCIEILQKYFKIIREVFPKEWENPDKYILSTDRGIRGLLRLCPYVLEYSNGLRQKSKAKKIFEVLRGKFDFRVQKLKGKYYGEGGADVLRDDWIIIIQEKLSDFGPRPQITDTKDVSAGELDKVKEFLEKYFSQFSGEVVGILMFIDETTPDYLKYIPKQCPIKIVITDVKGNKETCKRKLTNVLEGHPEAYIREIFQEIDKDNRANVCHGRWLASKEIKIDLENDLKNDAQNKKHTIKVFDRPHLDNEYRDFRTIWKAPQGILAKKFGKNTKSEFFYPR